MSQIAQPSTTRTETDEPGTRSHIPAAIWRVAGGLAIAHVVLLLAGVSQESLVGRGASAETVQQTYGGANLTRVFTGGYIESVSFLVLAAAVVVIARIFGRRTETGRLAAQTFLALGVAFVATTLAVGFAPGASALYWSQHGADLQSVSMVNDIRNYGYILQTAIQAGMALALGIAVVAEKVLAKWVGWVGIVLGAAGIVVVPLVNNGFAIAWLVWWLGMGVLLLRGPRTAARSA